MPLPSQSARPVNRRSHMSRQRRSRRRLRGIFLIIIAIGIVGVGGWLTWNAIGTGKNAATPPPSKDVGTSGTTSAQPVASMADERKPADPPREPAAARTPPATPPPAAVARQDPPVDPIGDPTNTSRPPVTTMRPPALAVTTDQTTDDGPPEPDAAGSPPPPVTTDPASSAARDRGLQRVRTARELAAANDPVGARRLLSEALASGVLGAAEVREVRAELEGINGQLIFGPTVTAGDPYALRYVVQPGDSLDRIVKRLSLQVDWRFIQRINQITRPERIRAGQQIKLITGPFHAVVRKSSFRIDLYIGDAPTRDFVCSFPVGLGEANSTPMGRFRVRPGSKLINPEWVNPRTRERFAPDDPGNPIGEHWIGLEGLDETFKALSGYGIHGTIEPQSIGRQASMGCVRMLPDDVAIVYEMLVDGVSTIEIAGQ